MNFQTLRLFTDDMQALTVSRNVQWLKAGLQLAVDNRALAMYADSRYSKAVMVCPGSQSSAGLFYSVEDGTVDYDRGLKVYTEPSKGRKANLENWNRNSYPGNHMVAYMYSPQASLLDSNAFNPFDYFFAPHPDYVHLSQPSISMADARLAFRAEVDKWITSHVRKLEGAQCVFDYRTGADVFSAVSLERPSVTAVEQFFLQS